MVGTLNVTQQVSQRMIAQSDGGAQGTSSSLFHRVLIYSYRRAGDRGAIVLTSSYVSTDGQSGSVGYTSTKGQLLHESYILYQPFELLYLQVPSRQWSSQWLAIWLDIESE